MSTYDLPDWFSAASWELIFNRATVGLENSMNGLGQSVDLLAWYWGARATLPPCAPGSAEAGAREAFFNLLAGGVDKVKLWHRYRPVPLGTLRGSPTLASSVAQFSDTLVIQADPGVTLLPGDMVGVAPQLFQVREGATANGSGLMAVKVVNRTRSSLASGLPVVWDRPTATFVTPDRAAIARYTPNLAAGHSIEFREAP